MANHKWGGKEGKRADSNHGGRAVACVKCGCVKEYVKGLVTYFIDDTVYPVARKCDERLTYVALAG